MPLCARLLGPSVIVSWTLWKLPDDSPFSYEGATTWASLEARDAALKTKEGLECIADLKNYVKKPAKVYLREEIGSGKASSFNAIGGEQQQSTERAPVPKS